MDKETLNAILASTPHELTTRAKLFIDEANIRLNEKASSSVEAAVFLSVGGELAIAASNMLKRGPHTLFYTKNKGDGIEQTTGQKVRSEEIKPYQKAFEELLRTRIANELLSPDDREITKNRLLELLRGENSRLIHGSHAIIHKIPKEQVLKRDKAINFIKLVLTRNDGANFPFEKYGKIQLTQYFRIKAKQLDDWGTKIGHSWEANPEIDKKTASFIHGLACLDKLLASKNKPIESSLHSV